MGKPAAKEGEAPELCKGCVNWRVFGNRCWFYWEGKKECSQHRMDEEGNTKFKSVKDLFMIV